ncbi:MAG: glutamate--tRNA ligase [Candidatus Bipolaricaulota bacterium]|nr:glutamate--tRNA ligase [Candidatus Bipolaricaulota bacterium]MDW8126186.1 glutamate--tRNA ligase [Candidatus Bipolaricaulota bacterium]
MDRVRVRFAPSPTGYLHVGGARTALFNWLFARHHGGTFILRIEDTDRTRSTDEAIEQIIASMRWLGLDWDEFYRQTERFHLHRRYAEELLRRGAAYEADGAIWFRIPKEGVTIVDDLIAGKVEFQNREFKDLVILRSDGTPTYNFACVVDDTEMGITHVIRGDEHLPNTPKQLHIYRALGLTPPKFAHIPLILGPDRTKLSKRHGAVSVLEYRRKGILPEAMVNFLARLGWSYGDQEIFSREELIRYFDLGGVGQSPAVFDEQKLLWLNREWMRRVDVPQLAEMVKEFLVVEGIATKEEVEALPKSRFFRAVGLLRDRTHTLVELAHSARFLFPGEMSIAKDLEDLLKPELVQPFLAIAAALDGLTDPEPAEIEATVRRVLDQLGLPLKAVALPMRVVVTGSRVGPGLFEVLAMAGPKLVAERLRTMAAHLDAKKG